VDRGALDAALELGMECGGWCPAGRLAEDGTIPDRYPLTELPTVEYWARTAQNVSEADGTLIISNRELSGGTQETLECCRRTGKPHLVIGYEESSIEEAIARAVEFARTLHPRGTTTVLNVAGPRASQWVAGYQFAQRLVKAVLRRLSGHKGAGEYSA